MHFILIAECLYLVAVLSPSPFHNLVIHWLLGFLCVLFAWQSQNGGQRNALFKKVFQFSSENRRMWWHWKWMAAYSSLTVPLVNILNILRNFQSNIVDSVVVEPGKVCHRLTAILYIMEWQKWQKRFTEESPEQTTTPGILFVLMKIIFSKIKSKWVTAQLGIPVLLSWQELQVCRDIDIGE